MFFKIKNPLPEDGGGGRRRRRPPLDLIKGQERPIPLHLMKEGGEPEPTGHIHLND